MPLPREETTPPVMNTNRVMGGQYRGAPSCRKPIRHEISPDQLCAARNAGVPAGDYFVGTVGPESAGAAGAVAGAGGVPMCGRVPEQAGVGAAGVAGEGVAGLPGTSGAVTGAAGAGSGASMIERPTPEVPRLSSASASDRAKNKVPRMAVVRVSKLAVPRPDMKLPMPWEGRSETAALAALDQHDADQGERNEQVDQQKDGGHRGSQRRAAVARRVRGG